MDPQTWMIALTGLGGAFCTAVAAIRLRQLRRAMDEAARWPMLPVAIVASGIRMRSVGGFGSQYQPEVTYQYRIGNRTYQNTVRTLGPQLWFDRRGQAEAILDRYPAGAVVDAWVDPADPTRATLERSVPYRRTLWWVVIATWAIVLFGGVALWQSDGF
jgi:hypothetical protein